MRRRTGWLMCGLACTVTAGCGGTDGPEIFRVAVLADTHIIDEYYEGPENTPLDTESIFLTRERLESARDTINAIDPPVETLFIAGDCIHNYPSVEWEFYQQNETRIDIFKEILDGFAVPVYPGLGNHDYDFPDIPRDFTHRLFREKLGIEPYYAVDLHGFRFIHLNVFLGGTMDQGNPAYDPSYGSLGREQLDWLEGQLVGGRPSILFLHMPLPEVAADEGEGRGLAGLLERYAADIRLVVAGHTHTWIDFGDLYGPPHVVIGSTRYDPDAMLLLELDTRNASVRILNWGTIGWGTRENGPYQPAGPGDG